MKLFVDFTKPEEFFVKFQRELLPRVGPDCSDLTLLGGMSNIPREVKRSHVVMINKIGQGGFGDVWKAMIDESTVGGVPGYLVAVKTTKDTDLEGAAELLREASLMARVPSHTNIVNLVGVVTSGTPLLLLITFCEHGALSSCLKNKTSIPTQKSKLSICLDVARGMDHLATSSIVHRDLAARNVLLDSLWTGKVADFGLSRVTVASTSDSNDVEMVYKSEDRMFAVRWTAPDTMETLRYTTASDVWSFGITLFEIYSNGARPYSTMDNEAVMKEVQLGYRLPKPDDCSDCVYKSMLLCWDANPLSRPSFTALIDILAGEERKEMFAKQTMVVPASSLPTSTTPSNYMTRRGLALVSHHFQSLLVL